MRYYFISTKDKEKHCLDLFIKKHDSKTFKIDVIKSDEKISSKNKEFFLRNISNNYFYSNDLKTWKKFQQFICDENVFLLNNNFYDVFRGYLPSGSSEDDQAGLFTSMPGKVIKIFVSESQNVKKGDTLLIIEAMKMENEIKAHIDGVVSNIFAKENQTIESGFLLLEIEKEVENE